MRTTLAAASLAAGVLCVQSLFAFSPQVPAAAPCTARPDLRWIVVIDSTPGPNILTEVLGASARHRIFSFPSPRANCTSAAGSLMQYLEQATKTADSTLFFADAAVRVLRGNVDELSAASTLRWQSPAGVCICAAFASPVPKVNFAEKLRASRLATDLKNLATIIPKLTNTSVSALAVGDSTAKSKFKCRLVRYELQQVRAMLAISVSFPKTDKAAAAADSLHATIITGPSEHFYLSANAGVTTAQQVTYDQGSKSVTPAKTPSAFYLGANWSFSDLNADVPASCKCNWDRIVPAAACEAGHTMAGLAIGGFLEASTKPINQAGLILGLRYLPWLKDYVDLHIVTPYAGVRWVRNEAVTGAGAASSGQAPAHFGSGKPIFGISFDIAQALTWLK